MELVGDHKFGSKSVACGLKNVGNTCYLNSVLQVLTHSRALVRLMRTETHWKNCPRKKSGFSCTLCELEKHVNAAWTAPSALAPWSLVNRLRHLSPEFILGRQHDAHEFLRILVDKMQESCFLPGAKLPSMEEVSKIKDPRLYPFHLFQGTVQSIVQCLTCSNESKRTEVFEDLQLEIQQTHSVEDALKKFTAKEFLEGSNAYACDHCKRKTRAAKQLRLHRTPPLLALQLKRFAFGGGVGGPWGWGGPAGYPSLGGSGGGGAKVPHWVRFQLKLDLTQFSAAREEGPKGSNPLLYSLYAVVVHFGSSLSAGHYYCYVRYRNAEWYKMDDSFVQKVDQDMVLKEKAYMLFYKCASSKERHTKHKKGAKGVQPQSHQYNQQIPANSCNDNPCRNSKFNSDPQRDYSIQKIGNNPGHGERFDGQINGGRQDLLSYSNSLQNSGRDFGAKHDSSTNANYVEKTKLTKDDSALYTHHKIHHSNPMSEKNHDFNSRKLNRCSTQKLESRINGSVEKYPDGNMDYKIPKHSALNKKNGIRPDFTSAKPKFKAPESRQIQAKSLKRPLSNHNSNASRFQNGAKFILNRTDSNHKISFSMKKSGLDSTDNDNAQLPEQTAICTEELKPHKKAKNSSSSDRQTSAFAKPAVPEITEPTFKYFPNGFKQRLKGSMYSVARQIVQKSGILNQGKALIKDVMVSNPALTHQEMVLLLDEKFLNQHVFEGMVQTADKDEIQCLVTALRDIAEKYRKI